MTYFDLIQFGQKRLNKTLQTMSMSATVLKVASDNKEGESILRDERQEELRTLQSYGRAAWDMVAVW